MNGSQRASWRDLYDDALAAGLSDNEARRLIEAASGMTPADIRVVFDDAPPESALPVFREMVRRSLAGEPLQYVVGSWGFRTLTLRVDSRALIPRPETEDVAGLAIAEARRSRSAAPVVADLGTGTGAIGLSIAVEVPASQVWLSDRSLDALQLAKENLRSLSSTEAARVHIVSGSWFDALPPELKGGLSVIVSNPPYVAEDEELPSIVVDWEPSEALIAGPTGCEDLQHLIAVAPQWLAPSGSLVLELAPHQIDTARQTAERAGFVEIEVHKDIAGRERALVARV